MGMFADLPDKKDIKPGDKEGFFNMLHNLPDLPKKPYDATFYFCLILDKTEGLGHTMYDSKL